MMYLLKIQITVFFNLWIDKLWIKFFKKQTNFTNGHIIMNENRY